MYKHLRTFLLALAAVAAAGQALAAPAWPARPVTIVVPYTAGGGTDAVARVLAQFLQKHWNQSVIVENIAGADGIIGTERALARPADGYTLVLQLGTMLLWKPAETGGRDLVSEMKLLSLIQKAPMSFAVSSKFPGSTIADYVQYCKGNPCGIGSATRYAQLIGTHFAETAGLKDTVQVSYKGGSQMTTDLLGGHLSMAIISVASGAKFVEAGQMKMLAVSSAQRFPQAPSIPTLAESGFQVFGESWYGLMTNKDVPAPALAALEEALKAAGRDPALRSFIERAGGVAVFNSPAEFEAIATRERAYLGPLLAKYPAIN